MKFTLNDGTGINRIILSGVHAYYEPKELVGKSCVAILNLAPCKMMGIDSCGTLLSAKYHKNGEEALHFLMVDMQFQQVQNYINKEKIVQDMHQIKMEKC